MASKSGPPEGIGQALVKVIAHPVRVQALSILNERAASPKQIAAELGQPVGNVSYHVRELEQVGLVELVDEKRRRGAVEHFYKAIPRPPLNGKEWEQLDFDERQSFSAWTLQLLLADATQSLSAGTFDARPDRHLSHTQLHVDEQGWSELTAILAEALRATAAVEAASAVRLGKSGERGFPVLASMLCVETLSRGEAGDDRPGPSQPSD